MKINPANEWGWSELLLNRIEYCLQILAWQNTEDAHSRHPQHTPEIWLPDFIPKPEKAKKNPEQQAMSVDDIKEYLSRPRESAKVKANE